MQFFVRTLLAAHVIPFFLMELMLFSLPLKKRVLKFLVIGIGTALNCVFTVVLLYKVMRELFSGNLAEVLKSFWQVSCSCQDVARFVTALLICCFASSLLSILIYALIRRFFSDGFTRFHHVSAVLMLWAFVLTVSLLGYHVASQGEKNIIITEICRQTSLTSQEILSYENEEIDADNMSYVVLKNTGPLRCETDDLYLSDDPQNLKLVQIAAGTLQPDETYVQVLPSGDVMNIREKGDTIICLSGSGGLIEEVTVPSLARDESCLRGENGTWSVISPSTYGNIGTIISEPVFSQDSGFYENEFDLVLSCEEGSLIYYTLDCSIPSRQSQLYSEPIHVYDRSPEENRYISLPNLQTDYYNREGMSDEPVEKAFIVRAVTVGPDGKTSEIATKTYFVNKEFPENRMVVSLVADPEDLFGDEGIYVTGAAYDAWYEENLEAVLALPKASAGLNADENGEILPSVWDDEPLPNFMREMEIQGNLEIIQRGGTLVNQPAGIKVSGASSRDVPIKRMSVFARKNYSGSKVFEAPIFGNTASHAIWLRYGLMNSFIPSLAADRDVAVLKSIPVQYYLNGEYWIDTYMCEKYNDTYFSENYNLNPDNICCLKIASQASMTEEEKTLYEQEVTARLLSFDMSTEEDYEEFCRYFDVQSYIDYTCINVIADNEDTDDMLNTLLWKTYVKENDSYGDGRWRWGLFDLDLQNGAIRMLQGAEHDYEANNFAFGREDRILREQPLYSALRKNGRFCRQFVLTFMDLINTDFSAENVLEKLRKWDLQDPGVSFEYVEEFYTNRSKYIVPYMAEEFGLTGTQETVTITSDQSGNPVILNTICPELSGPNHSWSGTYYTDIPVTVSAAAEGFDHWEVTSAGVTESFREPTIEVPVTEGGVVIHAVFGQPD